MDDPNYPQQTDSTLTWFASERCDGRLDLVQVTAMLETFLRTPLEVTTRAARLIDRVCAAEQRKAYEVPVGFKWFAPGLFDGTVAFGG